MTTVQLNLTEEEFDALNTFMVNASAEYMRGFKADLVREINTSSRLNVEDIVDLSRNYQLLEEHFDQMRNKVFALAH